MKMLLLSLAIAATLMAGADAWWCTGHMITAEIARQNLEPGVEAKVNAYFTKMNQWGPFPQSTDMVNGACWADDIRSQGLKAMFIWHFVNIPYIVGGFTPAPGVAEPLQNDNIMNQIVSLAATAQNRRGRANEWELAFAVANLVHFYGDIHQPLHSTAMFSATFPDGDQGGNLFSVEFQNTTWHLHQIWDSVCGRYQHRLARPLNATSRAFIVQQATAIAAANPSTAALRKVWNTTVMAYEGHADAIAYAYARLQPGDALSAAYLAQCGKVADLRLALGGYRLAAELNYVFGSRRGRSAHQ
jgi:hypothetical protein